MTRVNFFLGFFGLLFLFCGHSYGAKFFKIEYTATTEDESLEAIVNQFTSEKNSEFKNRIILDTIERNGNISDWKKIPINSTLMIFISEEMMANRQLKDFIAQEEKKRKKQERLNRKKLELLKNNFLTLDRKVFRQQLFSGYFFRKIRDVSGIYTVNSNFVPVINLGYEAGYLHKLNRWKVDSLFYHIIVNFRESGSNSGLAIPLAYSLRLEAVYQDICCGLSPYFPLEYAVFPDIFEDDNGFAVRVTKNLSSGIGMLYQYYFRSMKVAVSVDYLADISSSSRAGDAEIEGGLLGSQFSLKIKFFYARNISFVDSWFAEGIYTETSHSNKLNDIEVLGSSYSTNLGLTF
ncbi:MAG: hypothetical protein A2504_04100 [Bdellovibrionales bacterium RIFOXYD12_FULL_39_22]|nr:MAG: hypothetical protein A2385_11850 [Bdellovibrionales bacterium RIFOXYB1_FULL_39_21]OFZ41755.1 MAG: hypothetical protein A2485_02160 [Bdellovibrionales bacterium RIFOXYC12_FULL_39_17]OFZ46155.1 MAG: hypothetical protein A2404_12525 [Bdellovibrionales bacterium RIFOXYC1_FULL_39_130]OFZ74981.1 MAG: hypothetical protein A2560_15565 [Bdellovibrionales bacterium RIFOXYD1_FULL_39_84]OFZ76254.1 MAG: hypothetical protein A2451_05405 [Bdellovibrionales bacterium RIFOXYC2_FULL_39_8]OFZ92834.1 MAG: